MSTSTADQSCARVLVISHTATGGTTLSGTTRADDLYGWLRSQGWNYRHTAGDFRLQGSVHRPAKVGAINRTASGLRERGFVVRVVIGNEISSFDEAEADRAASADVRTAVLERRAARLAGQSEARENAGRAVLDNISLGQPYIVDSSGYAADRHRREKALNNLEAAAELGRQADRVAEQAEVSARHMEFRANPETVANRIRELEARHRKITRELKRADEIDKLVATTDQAMLDTLADRYGTKPITDEHRQRLGAELAWLDEQLPGWRQVREGQIADGTATNYTRDMIAKGDFVARRGNWFPVLKVNKVSVTVPHLFGLGTTTIRYEHIADHVRPGDARWETAKASAIRSALRSALRYAAACGPHESIRALMDGSA